MKKVHKTSQVNGRDIAVIGMAGRFPGAKNLDEFWENLKKGRETISFFSDKELIEAGIPAQEVKKPNYVKAKGILKDIDLFDADFFGYPPREAEKMDPQIRILHECAWEALENSGYYPEAFPGLIGVYFGANENHEWIRKVHAITTLSPEDFDSFILNYRDYIATRISYKLNLRGPSFTLLTACSTSLVAIHLACQALMAGQCHMAIAGGVSLSFPQKCGYLYQEGIMVSSDGHCRTFDAKADGTVFGDGVGVVVLKPLKKALDEGDYIHAVIKGSAINNDGNNKVGFTAPSADGQAQVIRSAIQAAAVKPENISYVETHGTGTILGDPIEIEALNKAFGSHNKQFCSIGSIKTNIGHVNIAAGVSSFIKTVLALEHRLIPPSLNYRQPNPHIDFTNSPFMVNTRLTDWESNGFPLLAGVSAFGFGGTNAHVILEEAPLLQRTEKSRPAQLLVFSARTASALDSVTANFKNHLEQNPHISLGDAAYTLCEGRKQFKCRRMLVGSSREDIIHALDSSLYSSAESRNHASTAFMFPGQGAQYVNVGKEIYQHEPTFRKWIDYCAEGLYPHLGLDIRLILYPEENRIDEASSQLKQTKIAQPVIFTLSYALARLWMEWGITPQALVGHSIGECVAACLAGVFTLDDSLMLIANRGQLMQKLPPGVMLAVMLSEKEIQGCLDAELSLAAVNGPSLCVVSGRQEPVAELRAKLKKKKIASQYLQTSHAFHSQMMDPILEPFIDMVRDLPRKSPQIPMVSTVTGDWLSEEEIRDPAYWSKNSRQTVRFSDAVQKLFQDTPHILLEVGPGRTLNTLAKLHTGAGRNRTSLPSLPTNQEKKSATEVLLTSLGHLWMSGIPINWSGFFKHERRNRIPLPTYPFERQQFWIESQNLPNHQALYDYKIPDMAEWFYIPSWKRTASPQVPVGKTNKKKKNKYSPWLIFGDELGLGAHLARLLKKENQDVVSVFPGSSFAQRNADEFILNPAVADNYDTLCRELQARGKFPSKILHLWNVSPHRVPEPDLKKVEHQQNLSFFSLLYLAQVIGKENITDEVSIYVVSNDLHDITGQENIDPEKATLLGPVKVIPQEYPTIKCCNIDILLPQKTEKAIPPLADRIMLEIKTNTQDIIVALRGHHRWIQFYENVRLDKSYRKRNPLKKGGVYLITGGLGGIGLVLAGHLAKTYQAKLILTGRTKFPPKKKWEEKLAARDFNNSVKKKLRKIRQIEKNGGQVYVLSADVTDKKAMAKGIHKAMEKLGSINGVIHAAGLPGEGILQLKRKENAQKILAPKIQGTLILEKILQDVELDFFMLCSSIASILGGIGLGDYCAANSFLDAYAQYDSSRKSGRITTVNWDMWGEVGMGLKTHMPDELQEWLKKELQNGLTSKEGIDAFLRILAWKGASNPHVIVSTRNLHARIDRWIKREFIKEREKALEQKSAKPKYSRPNLSTDYVDPETETEKKVAEIWGMLFGVKKIGRNDNFYELGGHSLLATSLLTKLRKEFRTNISIRDVLDHPTLAELCALLKN